MVKEVGLAVVVVGRLGGPAWRNAAGAPIAHRMIVARTRRDADDLVLRNEAGGRYAPTQGPTRVFLAVGDREERADGVGHSMVSQMETFASALAARGDPELRVRHRVFEDETHASIFPGAFSTGVRTLFAGPD